MTQHSSLKVASIGARHRNVLKRHERVAKLRESEDNKDWKSAYKLPKVKLIKLKVKKAKGKEEAAGAEGAAPTEAKPAAAAAKAPAAGKAPTATQDKAKK